MQTINGKQKCHAYLCSCYQAAMPIAVVKIHVGDWSDRKMSWCHDIFVCGCLEAVQLWTGELYFSQLSQKTCHFPLHFSPLVVAVEKKKMKGKITNPIFPLWNFS